MIAEGRVAIDGSVIDTPATLLPSLRGVTVDGVAVKAPAPARLFRFHKPRGLLTTERDPAGRPTIYDRLPHDLPRVMPVGRLDMNTEGLLLLTTDGELKRQLELPATGVERSYRARAYGEISQAQLEELIEGVEIDGVRYGSIDANLERRTGANVWIEMTLTEGKNREVRRVLEHLGLEVSRLIRTRYGPFVLADMETGSVDEIRQHDIVAFRKTLALPPAKRQWQPVVGVPLRAAAEEVEETPTERQRPARAAAGPGARAAARPGSRTDATRPGTARPVRKATPDRTTERPARPRQGGSDAARPPRQRARDENPREHAQGENPRGERRLTRSAAPRRDDDPRANRPRRDARPEYDGAGRIRAARPAGSGRGRRGDDSAGSDRPSRDGARPERGERPPRGESGNRPRTPGGASRPRRDGDRPTRPGAPRGPRTPRGRKD